MHVYIYIYIYIWTDELMIDSGTRFPEGIVRHEKKKLIEIKFSIFLFCVESIYIYNSTIFSFIF